MQDTLGQGPPPGDAPGADRGPVAGALPERVDVLVVGAGTAGSAAAALCAERGLRTLCIERGPLDRAGARWVNGVLGSAFDTAGLARPTGAERRSDGGRFHLVAGYGPDRITIEHHGVLEVDMRLLVSRLQTLAQERGATVLGNARVHGVERNVVRTERGTVTADTIIDASGLAGARLLGGPHVGAKHLCAAAQQVHRIADHAGARAFFHEHRVALGEVVCFAGIAGGYSILNVRCEDDHVSILTGSIPALGHPSGAQMLERFVAEQSWIGDAVFGGTRAIPLRRPFDRIASGRVAAIGDAAAQVFPAHGSGIGPGLIAARVLADALADGSGVQQYATDWQRRWGGLLAAYDVFRRFSQSLSVEDLGDMMRSGLMDPELARFGMAQQHPRLTVRGIPGKVRTLTRQPRRAASLGRVVARMLRARALYARYPRNPAKLASWSRRIGRVFGDPPDVQAPANDS